MADGKHVVWTPDDNGNPLFLEWPVYRGFSFSSDPDKARRFERGPAIAQRFALRTDYSVWPVFIATFASKREMTESECMQWLKEQDTLSLRGAASAWAVMYQDTRATVGSAYDLYGAIRAARRALEAK